MHILKAAARELGVPVHLITGKPREVVRDLLPVSYTHLRAHETPEHLVCRLLLEKHTSKILKTTSIQGRSTVELWEFTPEL